MNQSYQNCAELVGDKNERLRTILFDELSIILNFDIPLTELKYHSFVSWLLVRPLNTSLQIRTVYITLPYFQLFDSSFDT